MPSEFNCDVQEIVKAIRAGKKMPPILVSENGFLQDGRHRLMAYKYLGKSRIDVIYGNHPAATVMKKKQKCNCKLIKQIKGWDIPDSEFDSKELAMGIKDEMEHTDDEEVAKAIAKGHLIKHRHYYTENAKRRCY